MPMKHGDIKLYKKSCKLILCLVLLVSVSANGMSAFAVGADKRLCGKEEHYHEDSCYTDVLICGMVEPGPNKELICKYKDGEAVTVHTHDDSCYETVTNVICGMDEGQIIGYTDGEEQSEPIVHIHDASCYVTEKVLVCDKAETEVHTHTDACYITTSNHKHTEACYKKELSCGKKEHVHTLECYADLTVDLETPAVWESTLPSDLGSDYIENLVAIAESQVGIAESAINFKINDKGYVMGYNRYGAWYGAPYVDWCAIFIAFCCHYAGLPEEAVFYHSYCETWMNSAKENGIFADAEGFVPDKGDIMFIERDRYLCPDHVTLVTSVEGASQKEGGIEAVASGMIRAESKTYDASQNTDEDNGDDETITVNVIEGNYLGLSVARSAYSYDTSEPGKILGYLDMSKAVENYKLLLEERGENTGAEPPVTASSAGNATVLTDETISDGSSDIEKEKIAPADGAFEVFDISESEKDGIILGKTVKETDNGSFNCFVAVNFDGGSIAGKHIDISSDKYDSITVLDPYQPIKGDNEVSVESGRIVFKGLSSGVNCKSYIIKLTSADSEVFSGDFVLEP